MGVRVDSERCRFSKNPTKAFKSELGSGGGNLGGKILSN